MDIRERVYRTIFFEQPDAVPLEIQYDGATAAKYQRSISRLLKQHPNHFLTVRYTPPKGSVGYNTSTLVLGRDEWGVTWADDFNMGRRVVGHPLQDWGSLDRYVFPDVDAEGRFDLAEKMIKENHANRFVVGLVWFTLFERLWFLRGFTNCVSDIMRGDTRISKLADLVMDFDLKATKRTLELGIDAVFFSDDYGHQRGLMFPLKVWENFFLPKWKQLFDTVHNGGASAMLHSCGDVSSIIHQLIEAGLDVLNPVQPQAMKIDEIGKNYSGKICFFGGVDVQGTLPKGTEQEVENEVRHLIWTLGDSNGGYIGGTSHTILPDTPLANIRAMYRAFDKWGVFRIG